MRYSLLILLLVAMFLPAIILRYTSPPARTPPALPVQKAPPSEPLVLACKRLKITCSEPPMLCCGGGSCAVTLAEWTRACPPGNCREALDEARTRCQVAAEASD